MTLAVAVVRVAGRNATVICGASGLFGCAVAIRGVDGSSGCAQLVGGHRSHDVGVIAWIASRISSIEFQAWVSSDDEQDPGWMDLTAL